MSRSGTYVYCVLDHHVRRRVPGTLRGLPYSGPVRLLPITTSRSLVVSDVPLARYGEAALKKGLSDLGWVSRVALAHERVVEAFLSADAVLPMKLFTMFASDERALAHFASTAAALDALARRVAGRDEWGIRVALGKPARDRSSRPRAVQPQTGAAYLRHKKAAKDEATRRAEQARVVAADLFRSLAAHASEARKRSTSELPVTGGPLVLDAALLVPRSASARFKAAAARQARTLASEGYSVALSGPWPPYSFMRD